MVAAVEPQLSPSADRRLSGPRRLLATLCLGGLAAAQVMVGGWALVAPTHFWSSFPAAGHAWVALLPPYNEHLVRDVGALSLATAVLLAVAAAVPTRLLVRTAVLAFATYAVPHTAFHALHLEGFAHGDAVGQMAGFVIQTAVSGIAFLTTVGIRAGRARA